MKKKINNKFLSAIFLGLLVLSGGVLAMPALISDNQLAQMQENIKMFEKNPEKFLQTENLGLKDSFQYPNYESTEGISADETSYAVNEGALEAAIEEGDYEIWKETLQKIEGFPEKTDIIDKEDFDILAALHKSKYPEESKKTDI